MACFLLRSCTHWELTFDIIKTEWMILKTVPAEMPSSWAITLTLMRRSYKNHVLHFLARFILKCFHWLTWTWIIFNQFPTPLKLLGPKLYLVIGRWNITIYSLSRILRTLAWSTTINLFGTRPQLVRGWSKRPLPISEKMNDVKFLSLRKISWLCCNGDSFIFTIIIIIIISLFISYKPLWSVDYVHFNCFLLSFLPPSLHSFLFPFSPYLYNSFYVFVSDFVSPHPHWFWGSLSLL